MHVYEVHLFKTDFVPAGLPSEVHDEQASRLCHDNPVGINFISIGHFGVGNIGRLAIIPSRNPAKIITIDIVEFSERVIVIGQNVNCVDKHSTRPLKQSGLRVSIHEHHQLAHDLDTGGVDSTRSIRSPGESLRRQEGRDVHVNSSGGLAGRDVVATDQRHGDAMAALVGGMWKSDHLVE